MNRPEYKKMLVLSDNAGFTLIEAVIAMLVFTVGALAMVSLQSGSINSNMLARENTEASSFAASLVENLRPLNYTDDAELADGNFTLPQQDQYTVSYSVQRDQMIDNTMLIQVTVTWFDRGVQKSVNLVSIKPDII